MLHAHDAISVLSFTISSTPENLTSFGTVFVRVYMWDSLGRMALATGMLELLSFERILLFAFDLHVHTRG